MCLKEGTWAPEICCGLRNSFVLCYSTVFVGNNKLCPKEKACQSVRDFYSKTLREIVWIR